MTSCRREERFSTELRSEKTKYRRNKNKERRRTCSSMDRLSAIPMASFPQPLTLKDLPTSQSDDEALDETGSPDEERKPARVRAEREKAGRLDAFSRRRQAVVRAEGDEAVSSGRTTCGEK